MKGRVEVERVKMKGLARIGQYGFVSWWGWLNLEISDCMLTVSNVSKRNNAVCSHACRESALQSGT
jgi:hypothetical protein